jgi:uncharacterized protein YacL (UPF0231 family)
MQEFAKYLENTLAAQKEQPVEEGEEYYDEEEPGEEAEDQ